MTMLCSIHGVRLTWEEGGPDQPTVLGRWVCSQCDTNLMLALDKAAASPTVHRTREQIAGEQEGDHCPTCGLEWDYCGCGLST